MNDFQLECDSQVKRIGEHLEQLYYGTSDELDELQMRLEELEEAEPVEPDQYEDESDEAYDIRYAEWEKRWDEWEEKRDNLQSQIDDFESETLESYFDDCLDISYIVDGKKEYETVRVWVTIGGPSIYVDTDKGAVILNWGSAHSEYYLSLNVINAIDDIFRELYEGS